MSARKAGCSVCLLSTVLFFRDDATNASLCSQASSCSFVVSIISMRSAICFLFNIGPRMRRWCNRDVTRIWSFFLEQVFSFCCAFSASSLCDSLWWPYLSGRLYVVPDNISFAHDWYAWLPQLVTPIGVTQPICSSLFVFAFCLSLSFSFYSPSLSLYLPLAVSLSNSLSLPRYVSFFLPFSLSLFLSISLSLFLWWYEVLWKRFKDILGIFSFCMIPIVFVFVILNWQHLFSMRIHVWKLSPISYWTVSATFILGSLGT